jgi:hypothetical protein
MKYQQYHPAFAPRTILGAVLASGLVVSCSGGKGSDGSPTATGGIPQSPIGTGGAVPSTSSTGAGGAAATGGASAMGGVGTGGIVGTGGQGGMGGKLDASSGGTGGDAGGSGGLAPPADAGSKPEIGGASEVSTGGGGGTSSGFLHVEGNKLLDSHGKSVRLTGVNWFGLETNNQEPHGVWTRDYRSMVKQIADLGFNTIRLPWANQILRSGAKASDSGSFGSSGPDAYDGTNPINKALAGKSPLEIMDKVIEAAGEFGVKIVLDNHSREPDGYMNEQVWYTDKTPEKQWIDDWVSLAKRYAGNTTVVAADRSLMPNSPIRMWPRFCCMMKSNLAVHSAGRLFGKLASLNQGWSCTSGPNSCAEYISFFGSDSLMGADFTPLRLPPHQ